MSRPKPFHDLSPEQRHAERRDAFALAFNLIKWCLASLVLVNGAALVAMLNGVDKLPAGALSAAPSFAVGLAAALTSGGLVAVAALYAAMRLTYNKHTPRFLVGYSTVSQALVMVMATFTGLLSFYCFWHGVIQLGSSIQKTEQAKAVVTLHSSTPAPASPTGALPDRPQEPRRAP